MTQPTMTILYDLIDKTWPAAATMAVGPFTIRQGNGGGSRVSAATLNTSATLNDIAQAEAAMTAMNQPRLFMVKDGQDHFDRQLENCGYTIMDPCNMYAGATADLRERPPHKTCFAAWPPLAAQTEIWEAGGIGPARMAVMNRTTGSKTTILGRTDDRPAGTVYAAIHNGCAMLHALEIAPSARRQGLGRCLTQATAIWAASQGASHLALITTQANAGANALYASLGMTVVGHYHYRIKPSETAT